MVGINENGDYAVKTGKILNKNRNSSIRYGSIFQVSEDFNIDFYQ
jgi:hypothetical protein